MKKGNVIKTIVSIILITSFGSTFFSDDLMLVVISGITALVCVFIENTVQHLKTKKILDEVKLSSKNYILCRENKYYFLLIGFSFLLASVSGTSMHTNVDLFKSIVLFILSIMAIIEWFKSMAVISDDKIVFNSGKIFNFLEIINIKYNYSSFSRRTIITLSTSSDKEELILKSNEFEKVKTYLESKVSI